MVHVLQGRADVLAGQVLAAQRVDEPAERPEQHLATLLPLRVADHHDLAAAEVDAGGGVLVGHPLAEPQGVFHRRQVVAVGPHSAPAGGRTEHRRVNRQDRPQTDFLVLEAQQFLVAVGGHVVEDLGLLHQRHRPAAVDHQHFAGDVRRRIGYQEHDRSDELLGVGRAGPAA